QHPVVVVSAMGKTTNKLLAIAASAIAGKREDYIPQLHDLRDYHSREARPVVPLVDRAELDRTLDDHFQELTELVKGLAVLGELTPRSIDAISSYGERLSSYIVAMAFRHFGMDTAHIDSRRVIVTDRRHTQAAPLFAEAAELAYFGAKVLHPATVAPAIEKNIPVLILNSRRPEVAGTRIVSEAVRCGNVVKSIACKRKITLVNIHSTRMLMAHGFLRR